MKNTISNIIYNSLYQVFILFVPLLTIPYVSRVLGVNGVGINALVSAVANFIGTVIIIGMYQLGPREIAKADQGKMRSVFFSLWRIQMIAGVLVISIYVIVISFFISQHKIFFLLEVPYLISYALDISWFFIGIGKVKKVILRNSLIKLSSLILIFIFVRNKNSLWVYILILSVSAFVANLIFWISLKRELPSVHKNTVKINSKPYIKQAIFLLVPQVALQLYTNLDNVIVGGIAGSTQLAYYDQSQKIARIIVAILTSASTIIMPKMAASKDKKLMNSIFKVSLDYTLILALYTSAMIMINVPNFIKWYYGTNFHSMNNNMFYVSVIIIFISYGGVFSNQYMLANGQYSRFSIPYYIGGVLNIGLNILLVNLFGADGGTLSLIITEFVICISRLYLVKDELNIKNLLNGQIGIVSTFGMTLIICLIMPITIKISLLLTLILQTLLGSIVFVFGLVIFRTRIINDVQSLLKKRKEIL